MKIGMIFPGQGSQFLGMGKKFYDEERIVQEQFEEASNCLDKNFVRLCFAASEKELRETSYAQTSIFLVSASIFKVINEKYQKLGKTNYTNSKLKELETKENNFYKKWSEQLEAQANTAYHNKE